jgi:hypothetical protein
MVIFGSQQLRKSLHRRAGGALLAAALTGLAVAPAASADVVRHADTGFRATAPADFDVRYERDERRYVIVSDRRGAAISYQRVRSAGQTHTIRRIDRAGSTSANLLRRIALSASGGSVAKASAKTLPAATVLSWRSPAPGGTIAGRRARLEIAVSSKSKVRHVDFRLGDVLLGRERYAPYEGDFDSRAFANGPHRLTATATLTNGTTVSSTIDVVVANGVTPPASAPTPAPAPEPAPAPSPAPAPAPAPAPSPAPPPAPASGDVLFRGDFEAGSFSGLYVQSLPGRATIVGGAFGSAHAARFEVRDGDVEPDTGSERSEVSLSSPKFNEGQDLYFRDSFRVPSTSSVGSSWQIINQLHETDFGGSPGIAVFLKAGPSIKVGAGDGSPTFLPSAPIQYDRWHDLVYRANLSRDGSIGFMEIWLDGVALTLANGQTRMYGQTIQALQGYLKAGIYRGQSHTGTSVIEHDNLIVGTSLAAVTGQ